MASLECPFCKEYIKTLGFVSKSHEDISRNHHQYMQDDGTLVMEYRKQCVGQWQHYNETGVAMDSFECPFRN